MHRDLAQLARHTYDVLIIGGGIYGVWLAWDAALRGLSVALLEKGDFGHATSSSTLRIIHGGFRYLQHGDIRRMRQSIYERKVLMRVAPYLVQPLPFVIPTYGHAMRGKGALSVGLALNDVIGFDRNHGQDPHQYIPRGRTISREECGRLIPGVEQHQLTGGAIFYDGQIAHAERLIVALARSAASAGAHMVNYVEVTGRLEAQDGLVGVTARDVLTDDKLDIRAGIVVNATGPWVDQVLDALDGRRPRRKLLLSKTFNLLVDRQLFADYAVGVYSRGHTHQRHAIMGQGTRLFFITPWHGRSLIGTAHLPYDAELDRCDLTAVEVEAFLDEINAAYPAADLQRQEVCFAYGGLLPVTDYGAGAVRPLNRPQILDHRAEGGVEGLISVVGVKFTEARRVAEQAVDLVFRKLGSTPPKSITAITPVYGGTIEKFDTFLAQESRKKSESLSAETLRYLIWRYGSGYPRVLRYLAAESVLPSASTTTPSAAKSTSLPRRRGGPEGLSGDWDRAPVCDQPCDALLEAEVRHGVREEMALKLADVVFRRTTLGIAGAQGAQWLRACAATMAQELGWDASKAAKEVEEVRAALSRWSSTS